jgi:hypothetical protein
MSEGALVALPSRLQLEEFFANKKELRAKFRQETDDHNYQ